MRRRNLGYQPHEFFGGTARRADLAFLLRRRHAPPPPGLTLSTFAASTPCNSPTPSIYIYFESAAHVWTVQVARTSFALSPNHPSRCGTATIALSSRNRTFSKTRLLLGFSVSGFPAEEGIASSAPLLAARLRSFTTAWFKWCPWTISARLHALPRVKCVSMARRRLSVL